MSNSPAEAEFSLQLRAVRIRALREFRFALETGHEFRFDFAWPDRLLAVEIHGGLHKGTKGGHTSGTGRYRDMRKHNIAALLGWTVLEFSPQDVEDGTAIYETEAALGIRSRAAWIAFEERMAPSRRPRLRTRRSRPRK